MKNNQIGLLITLVVITVVIGLIAIFTHSRILIIPMIICGILVINGVIIIPNDPPHIGIKTTWGTRTATYLEEGLNFLFLRGIINSCILINMTQKNIDFGEQVLITPDDNVSTKVKSSISYTPDKKNLITYQNVKGEEGVNKMIQDIEEEKLRIWSRSNTVPTKWEEVEEASEEAIKIIISEICGATLTDADIKDIRKGNGEWPIPHFGIILNRYNLTKMEPFGEIYEASIAKQREEKERKSESYEIKTELSKAKILQKELKKNGVVKNLDEVIKLMMQWKIEREANKLVSLSSIAKIIAGSMKGGQS